MKKKHLKHLLIIALLILIPSITLLLQKNPLPQKNQITYNGTNLLVSVDGKESQTLPTEGNYYLSSYQCDNKNTKLSWNNETKELSITNETKEGSMNCDLSLESTPYLNKMKIGSYVEYTGVGGTVGEQEINCKTNEEDAPSEDNKDTESGNSCLGKNARESIDTNNNTYGYCQSSTEKYYTKGFRIAYINDDRVILISAASPECLTNSQTNLDDFHKTLFTKALKYCNPNLVDGNCTCQDEDKDNICDAPSTSVWTINDTDFYYITKALTGEGKRLTETSSSLGEAREGFEDKYCLDKQSKIECGYNNDLIDNGGYYWLSNLNEKENKYLYFSPIKRSLAQTDKTLSFGIRIMINLKSTVKVIAGDGTMESPYKISE